MTASLSSRDSSVLNALFDPESSSDGRVQPALQKAPLPQIDRATFDALAARERRILQHIDATRDQDKIRQGITRLTELVCEQPGYASAYSNRAQARRLLVPVRDLFTVKAQEESADILGDLELAISTAHGNNAASIPSQYQCNLLAAAYTHKGFLLLRVADLTDQGNATGIPAPLNTMSVERIQDLASVSFSHGAKYGNSTARQMAVKTNPYAKMCGAIVKEAMRQDLEGYYRENGFVASA